MWAYMLGSARGNSTRYLEQEPWTVPSAQTRPPETERQPEGWVRDSSHTSLMNQGVSMRDSPYVHLTSRPQYVRTCVRPSGEGVSGGDKHASPYFVLATQRRSPPRVRGSGRTNVLALCVGIFQYNNVLVSMVRRVARMRRHLTSIRITYRYRELYDAYRKSAEG